MTRFTNREKAECAERETAMMREIAAEYRKRAEQDEPRML